MIHFLSSLGDSRNLCWQSLFVVSTMTIIPECSVANCWNATIWSWGHNCYNCVSHSWDMMLKSFLLSSNGQFPYHLYLCLMLFCGWIFTLLVFTPTSWVHTCSKDEISSPAHPAQFSAPLKTEGERQRWLHASSPPPRDFISRNCANRPQHDYNEHGQVTIQWHTYAVLKTSMEPLWHEWCTSHW